MNDLDPFNELVGYFAPTVGVERSQEVVRAAARDAGVALEEIDDRGARAILVVLSRQPGIVGVAARFAMSRRVGGESLPAPTVSPSVPDPERPIHRRDIVALLEGALEPPEVAAAVDEAWSCAGIVGDRCSAQRATALLDAMAHRGGRLAIAATFAKARWHLRRP